MNVNSKDITEKLTFREKRAVVSRLLREIHLLAPSFIAVTVVKQLCSVSVGYIGIYLSTMVLNGLQEGVSAESLIRKVMLWMLVTLALYILTDTALPCRYRRPPAQAPRKRRLSADFFV